MQRLAIAWERTYTTKGKKGVNGCIQRVALWDDTYVMFTRWKSPLILWIPLILSLLDSHDSPFFGTLTHPLHRFCPGVVVSLTTLRSSNGLMILFNNTLLALSSFLI